MARNGTVEVDPDSVTDLESAIRMVYHGPLEEFVSRRAALAAQLRATGRREDAARVKGLRKPSRTAWALNNVVVEDVAPIEQLATAITAAQVMQSGEAGAARAALENVRAAVRAVAHAGARAAIRGGHPIESTTLGAAVHAVMGDANAFAELRAGRLVEIPEGGGLDILTAVTLVPRAAPATAEPGPVAGTHDAGLAAARAELQRAEASLAEARERARAAERAVLTAQEKLETAEQQLQQAREESNARRTELDRARLDAKSAARLVHDAERAVAAVRARIE